MSGRRRITRVNQSVSALTARASSHTIVLGLVVTAIGIFLAYIAWVSVNGPPFQNRYELNAIVPSDAPILKSGGAVRVAGKLAGTITEVEPDPDGVRVSMELRPDYAPVGRDARASVRVRSIVYLTYLEIQPGDRDDAMPEGGTIPIERTGSGVDLLEVVQLFDERTRDVLRRSLVNLGQGVGGRGSDLNVALADLDETLERGVPQLQALTPQPGALGGVVAGAAGTASELTGFRGDDVAGLIGSGNAVVGSFASRSGDLGAAIELLPPFEEQFLSTAPLLDPILADAEGTVKVLAPVARKLTKGLPQVNRLLASGRPLRRETKRIGRLVNPVLKLARPQLYALYPTVASLEPLVTALSTTVQTLTPYEQEITLSGELATSATSVIYPEGQTAPGNPALRFVPVFTCQRPRDPYPDPGESLGQSQAC